MLKLAKDRDREARRERAHLRASEEIRGRGTATAELREARDLLRECRGRADLLLTDPPYRTDVEDVAAFVQGWMPAALGALTPGGRAYLFVGAYSRDLHAYLAALFAQELRTVEPPLVRMYRNTLGPAPSHAYKLNWQAMLRLTEARGVVLK